MKGGARLAKKMARSASLSPTARFVMNCTYLDQEQKASLYAGDLLSDLSNVEPAERHYAAFDEVSHADFLNQMLYLDTKIFMVSLNLTYNDKMSMASSVEVRVPFLDRELAEFVAWNVPPHMKLRGMLRPTTKYIFRKAMHDVLPAEVLRQPKAGFAAPVDYWLAHDLKEMVDDLLSSKQIRDRGLFQPEKITHSGGRAAARHERLVDANLAISDARIVDANVSRRRSAKVGRGNDPVAAGGDRMKQVLQQPSTGEISVAEVPAPQLLPGCVLVSIRASLVSAGTERASSEFARKSLLQKAQARPDLVREVINKVRRDGLLSAVQAVRSRLDQPTSLGYSSAGIVTGVGEGVTDIAVGDRVACAGAGYAVHAEAACVPRLLVAKIPDGMPVSFDEAAFTTVGSSCPARNSHRRSETRGCGGGDRTWPGWPVDRSIAEGRRVPGSWV